MRKIFLEAQGRTVAGNAVIKMAEVFYSVLINDIGIRESIEGYPSINNDSFQQLNLLRNEWQASFSIDRYDSEDFVNSFASQSASIITFDSMNRLKVIPFCGADDCPIIDMNDIVIDEYWIPQVKANKTNEYYNSFSLQYYKDYATGGYLKMEFVNPQSTSMSEEENSRIGEIDTYTGLCGSSLSQYGERRDLNIKSDFIRDRTTAVNLIKHLAERWTLRRELIFLKAHINAKTIALELGDAVKIIWGNNENYDLEFMVTGVNLNLLKGFIDFTFLQLK